MELSKKVLGVLSEEGISAEELGLMVDRAAITSLRGCNRRYFHWLFRLSGDKLEDMQLAQLVELGDGEESMNEPHENCGGGGCRECGWTGLVVRKFTAPVY